MTKFEKVAGYYNDFDEWKRLDTPEGHLELILTLDVIKKHVPAGSRVLDLGGGPGRYTAELAKSGYIMSLGDLSPKLIEIARERTAGISNIESIDVVNAVDLSIYPTGRFDAVLYMGPLYHLTSQDEIRNSLEQVARVLKSGGLLLASFIPFLGGLAGIVERSAFAPDQANAETIVETFLTGVFHNRDVRGFQEGKYMRPSKVRDIMQEVGFNNILMRSVRGLGYRLEKSIIQKKTDDLETFNAIIDIINQTSEDQALVETAGHALYLGRKIT